MVGEAWKGELIHLGNGVLQAINAEGERLTMVRWTLHPLDLAGLLEFKDGKPVDLVFTDVEILGRAPMKRLCVNVEFPNLLKSYCAVTGGWVPPAMGLICTSVFPDRNFFNTLKTLFVDNKPKPEHQELEPWFSDLSLLNFSVHVLPFAFEGNKKRFPTYDEVVQQIGEARGVLEVAAPGVRIETYRIPVEDYAWKLVTHYKPITTKRMEFLTAVAAHLKPTLEEQKVRDRWRAISAEAAACGLKPTDIVVLLAYICVSAPQKDSLGMGVLKISHPYDQEKAYGACTDIALIEWMINHQTSFGSQSYSLCSSDMPLIKLSAIMRKLRRASSDGQSMTMTATIPLELAGASPALQGLLAQLMRGEPMPPE